ncbi:hypothetical protein XENORESO_003798 [Xenotaenia resolanae]|uniref:Uncharacterized protein n=1 Tax=Xenotaenia resolanae TaxID=208358 RepID=A0ABV0WJV0_9TELE
MNSSDNSQLSLGFIQVTEPGPRPLTQWVGPRTSWRSHLRSVRCVHVLFQIFDLFNVLEDVIFRKLLSSGCGSAGVSSSSGLKLSTFPCYGLQVLPYLGYFPVCLIVERSCLNDDFVFSLVVFS